MHASKVFSFGHIEPQPLAAPCRESIGSGNLEYAGQPSGPVIPQALLELHQNIHVTFISEIVS
jgi:hypothetical protein